MMWLHRRYRSQLPLHFAGELTPPQEAKLRNHLARCGECRALHAAFSLSEGGQDARRARMEAALFGDTTAPKKATGTLWIGAAIGSVCALLLALGVGLLGDDDSAFRSKGAGTTAGSGVSIVAYQPGKSGALQKAEGSIKPGGGLAFAYTNGSATPFDRLMIFALDEQGTVYWYYPRWQDAQKNPAAITIQSGTHELKELIRHSFAGSRLRLFGVFSKRQELNVRHVEQVVQQAVKAGATLDSLQRVPLPDTVQHVLSFDVVQD